MTKAYTRIFLADDDEDDCLLFKDALNDMEAEFELIVSNDGEELMRTFDEKVPPSPDVLFLDLNMPRKDGFECLLEMKKNDKLKDIPVVIFSTSGDHSYIQKTFQAGANFYVRKPRTYDLLKEIIAKILSINLDAPRRLETFVLNR